VPTAYIKGRDGIYRFVLPEGSEIDALRFEELCRQGRAALNSGDRSTALSTFTEALSIYRGEFLTKDPDSGWNTEIRLRLHNLYTTSLFEVSEMHFRLFSYEACIEWLTRLLATAPLEERAYYMLMRCHYALGDRPNVIRIFERCKKVLHKELGLEPGDDILELYHQIHA
jgi:LuxR family maltose regulon positive regulatory protein